MILQILNIPTFYDQFWWKRFQFSWIRAQTWRTICPKNLKACCDVGTSSQICYGNGLPWRGFLAVPHKNILVRQIMKLNSDIIGGNGLGVYQGFPFHWPKVPQLAICVGTWRQCWQLVWIFTTCNCQLSANVKRIMASKKKSW